MPDLGTISEDLTCRNCAYNLRGLRYDGLCPECGEPIANSFQSATSQLAKLLDDDPVNMARRLKFQGIADELNSTVDAVLFVFDAIDQFRRRNPDVHANPRMICSAVRDRAKQYFNDAEEARELLEEWGVRTGEDVGKISFALARHGLLNLSNEMRLVDFEGLFALDGAPPSPSESIRGTLPERGAMDQRKDKRPIIGITIDQHNDADKYESPLAYAKAVELAGGLPLLIPYQTDLSLIPQYVYLFDGLLFSGGNDLDPALYGQSWHPKAQPIDPARQKFELALLAEVERRRTPVLGVCLGSQIMNVYRGGSMQQFIPDVSSDIEHRKVGEMLTRHEVTLDPNSQIGKAIGKTEISVNTYHKQSADRIGRGLKVVATAPDGVIEGFEDPTFPLFAAVQWHPERLTTEPEHLAPFKLLVDVSRTAAKNER
jgi:putative glutamine amidotransferase